MPELVNATRALRIHKYFEVLFPLSELQNLTCSRLACLCMQMHSIGLHSERRVASKAAQRWRRSTTAATAMTVAVVIQYARERSLLGRRLFVVSTCTCTMTSERSNSYRACGNLPRVSRRPQDLTMIPSFRQLVQPNGQLWQARNFILLSKSHAKKAGNRRWHDKKVSFTCPDKEVSLAACVLDRQSFVSGSLVSIVETKVPGVAPCG